MKNSVDIVCVILEFLDPQFSSIIKYQKVPLYDQIIIMKIYCSCVPFFSLSADSLYQKYLSKLPRAALSYMDHQLDSGSRGLETDLVAIAHFLLNWEENLADAMELTPTDVHDIKHGQYHGNHELQR